MFNVKINHPHLLLYFSVFRGGKYEIERGTGRRKVSISFYFATKKNFLDLIHKFIKKMMDADMINLKLYLSKAYFLKENTL